MASALYDKEKKQYDYTENEYEARTVLQDCKEAGCKNDFDRI